MFIFRSSNGTGSVDWNNVQLRWNYGTDGLADNATVKVFTIEMVYIPQASFSIGDPDGTTGPIACFYKSGATGDQTCPISSEAAINGGRTAGYLWYDHEGSSPGDTLGPIPADFPKGYNAFYPSTMCWASGGSTFAGSRPGSSSRRGKMVLLR